MTSGGGPRMQVGVKHGSTGPGFYKVRFDAMWRPCRLLDL